MSRSLDGSPYASERSARSLEPTGAFALVLILAKTAIFDPDIFHSNKENFCCNTGAFIALMKTYHELEAG